MQQRGHRVSLIGIADAEERVRAAGLEFVPIDQVDYPAGSTKQLFNRLGELSGAAAFRTTVAYFQQVTAMLLREAPPALRIHVLDLPFVSVSCALLLNPDPAVPPVNTGQRLLTRLAQPITQVVVDYRQQHHLPALIDSAQAWSPLAQICQQPAAFEYPRSQPVAPWLISPGTSSMASR